MAIISEDYGRLAESIYPMTTIGAGYSRSRKHGQPEELFGNLEPGDPKLQDYEPGHPWYYLLEGRPLRPEEIRGHIGALPFDTKYNSDWGKYRRALMTMRRKVQDELKRDIQRYQEVLTKPEKPMSGDSQIQAQAGAISLVHNHIYHCRSEIKAIDNEMLLLTSPSTYSQCRVELLIREWLGKKGKDLDYERGAIGRLHGSTVVIYIHVKKEHWDTLPTIRLLLALQGSGWKYEVEECPDVRRNRGYCQDINIYVPQVLIPEEEKTEPLPQQEDMATSSKTPTQLALF